MSVTRPRFRMPRVGVARASGALVAAVAATLLVAGAVPLAAVAGTGDYSSPEAPVCSGGRTPEVVRASVTTTLGTTCRTTSARGLRTEALNGTVALVGGTLLYRSDRGFTGIDRITVYVPNDDGSIRFATFVMVDVR